MSGGDVLVPMREGHGGPVVVVHPIGGSVAQLEPLVRALATSRPVYGVQAIGLAPGVEPQDRVEQMADTYAAALLELDGSGPYALIGYSFGSLPALETARRLRSQGIAIDALILIEPRFDRHCLPPLPLAAHICRRSLLELQWRLSGYASKLLRRPVGRLAPTWPPATPVELAALRAFRAYRPAPYDGAALALMCRQRGTGFSDPRPVLGRTIRSLCVKQIEGTHYDAVTARWTNSLGELLSNHIPPPATGGPELDPGPAALMPSA